MQTTPDKQPLTPLQDRFLRSGFQGFSEAEIMEMVFSCFMPPDLARQRVKLRMRQFGNIRGYLRALPEDLEQANVAPRGRLVVRLFNDLPAELLKRTVVNKPVYESSQEFFDYLYFTMRDLKTEVFKVIYLDSGNKILEAVDFAEGTGNGVHIDPRAIAKSASRHSASALLFAHNHPSGDPTPSKTDKQFTRDLVFIGNILQIRVLDHIVVGDNKYFSFADEGLIDKYSDDFLTLRLRAFASQEALCALRQPVPETYPAETAKDWNGVVT